MAIIYHYRDVISWIGYLLNMETKVPRAAIRSHYAGSDRNKYRHANLLPAEVHNRATRKGRYAFCSRYNTCRSSNYTERV